DAAFKCLAALVRSPSSSPCLRPLTCFRSRFKGCPRHRIPASSPSSFPSSPASSTASWSSSSPRITTNKFQEIISPSRPSTVLASRRYSPRPTTNNARSDRMGLVVRCHASEMKY
ncbi:hypothetical protein Vafri_1573, partial [Volvox africanus]